MTATAVPDGVTAGRMQVAVHELGHLTVWERLDGTVKHVRLWTTLLGDLRGEVAMRWPSTHTQDAYRGYLVGLVAGDEADHLWQARTGLPVDPLGARADLREFRRALAALHKPDPSLPAREQREHARQLRAEWSATDLRAQARRQCQAAWPTMLRRAEQLARRGRL